MPIKIILLFFILLLSIACNPNKIDKKEKNYQDSLQKALNNPELDKLNKALLSDINNDSLFRERAYLYIKLNQIDAAINDCKRAIKIDSTNIKNHLTLADIYFASNKTKLSKDKLEQIIKLFPENTEAYLKLAELFYLVKQYEKSIDYINKALKIDASLAKGYYIKGNIYKESGDTSKAVSSLQTAIEQDNNMTDAYIDLGIIYSARKNSLALQYFNNALKINPDNKIALYDKAKFLQDVGEVDKSIEIYQYIIKIYPDSPDVLYNMGAIYFALKKDNNKAIEYFTQAIQQNNNYAEAYYARGIVKMGMHQKLQAKEDFEHCLKLKENFQPAVEAMNELDKHN